MGHPTGGLVVDGLGLAMRGATAREIGAIEAATEAIEAVTEAIGPPVTTANGVTALERLALAAPLPRTTLGTMGQAMQRAATPTATTEAMRNAVGLVRLGRVLTQRAVIAVTLLPMGLP